MQAVARGSDKDGRRSSCVSLRIDLFGQEPRSQQHHQKKHEPLNKVCQRLVSWEQLFSARCGSQDPHSHPM